MAEFDHGIKIIASTNGRELARVAGLECQRWQPLESTLPATTELLADRAFRAQQAREHFVVYFEFYTTWNLDAPWDMLAKAGLLSRRERLPVVCVVFVLRPRGYQPQRGEFRLEAAGGVTQLLRFREVYLWRVEPQDWWEAVPGLMALYPLCRHGRRPQEAVRLAAEAIERRVSEPGERTDDLVLLSIFGGLAYPRLDVAGIIGRAKMQESRLLREVRVETRRSDVLANLEARFGPESRAELESAVNAVTDYEELHRLLRLAASCASLDQFRTALPRQEAMRRPRNGTRRGRSRAARG
jgi:hypothetical protein